jgi:hypothetical protein
VSNPSRSPSVPLSSGPGMEEEIAQLEPEGVQDVSKLATAKTKE